MEEIRPCSHIIGNLRVKSDGSTEKKDLGTTNISWNYEKHGFRDFRLSVVFCSVL